MPRTELQQQPRLVQGILDGVSSITSRFKPLPGVEENIVVQFVPDVEKRDAVVRAFQVRSS